MSQRKKILWLVSWYPNKYNWFDGDFIQRHARAAAVHHNIHVLFIKQFEEQTAMQETLINKDGVTEQIIYLPKRKGWHSKLHNFMSWQRCNKNAVKAIIDKEGLAFIHVHIPWKAGLIAIWAKREFNLPFLLTDHWGIYNNIVEDNIYTKSALFRRLLKRIYQQAAAFVSVSRYLGEGVNKTLVKKEFSVIPNVVDTALFYPHTNKFERFTFVHVSNMVPLKNVEVMLKAFSAFSTQTRANAQFVFIGNKDETYPKLAADLGLLNLSVFFKGEVEYAAVAQEMQRCHAFVLASSIENSPCVIGESLCCGLPVIATAVGGIPELINEENGLLTVPQDINHLAHALSEMFQNYSRFHMAKIALSAAEKFGVDATAAAFYNLYKSYTVH